MATYAAMVRSMEAAKHREQRAAQKTLRDLERQAKEAAKLSVLEQARLEVDTYEKRLEVLLSVHKEQGRTWNWIELASLLAPVPPQPSSLRECKARQRQQVATVAQRLLDQEVSAARVQDEQAFQEASVQYTHDLAEWKKVTSLATRILAGEHPAYEEAMVELNLLTELVELGCSIDLTVLSPTLVECQLKVNGKQAVPVEHKSLTGSGKLAVKLMPKARFHEIYQNYVCGCMLRVARELFAVLPLDTVLITASAEVLDLRTGLTAEHPVVSAVMPRATIMELAFDQLDPGDAMENFQHRGDFKVSRKVDAFQPILPLRPSDIVTARPVQEMTFREVLAQTKKLRAEVGAALSQFLPQPDAVA